MLFLAILVSLSTLAGFSNAASAESLDACDFDQVAQPGDYLMVSGVISWESEAVSQYLLHSVECQGASAALEAGTDAAKTELDRCVGGIAIVTGWVEEHCYPSPFSADDWCYVILFADEVVC